MQSSFHGSYFLCTARRRLSLRSHIDPWAKAAAIYSCKDTASWLCSTKQTLFGSEGEAHAKMHRKRHHLTRQTQISYKDGPNRTKCSGWLNREPLAEDGIPKNPTASNTMCQECDFLGYITPQCTFSLKLLHEGTPSKEAPTYEQESVGLASSYGRVGSLDQGPDSDLSPMVTQVERKGRPLT